MKTKVYKLAAELGVREDRVLEWLSGQGYPHMRRADMVRSDLVDAARSALANQGRSASAASGGSNTQHQRDSYQDRVARAAHRDTVDAVSESLTSSFAELLGEHLERHPNSQSIESTPLASSNQSEGQSTLDNVVSLPQPSREVMDARLTMERDRFEERLKVSQAETRAAQEETLLLRREVDSSRNLVLENAQIQTNCHRLEAEVERLASQLSEVEHERATLDTTCAGLQARLSGLDDLKSDFDDLESDHSSIITDLEATQVREVAWRARALELERASQTNGLELALSSASATSLKMRQNLLIGLLSADKTAQILLKSIEKIDQTAFETLIQQRTRRVCANTLCRRCVTRQGRTPIVVDEQSSCEICGGDEGRRFFEAMVCEAASAGIRRMLIYGASERLKKELHMLSEGHQLDLRLVDRADAVSQARAEGRIDGCDCFVTWTQHVLEPNPYLEAARKLRRMWVMVNSSHDDLAAMSRQIAYRLARYSHLATQ